MDDERLGHEQFRRIIRQQIAELEDSSETSRESRQAVELDQTRQGRLSRMDAMQGQQMANATEARRRHRIARLEVALRRIDNDEFGDCLECGDPIASVRLKSDPAATLCVACATERERG
ncbi:MAG: TraR/DksA C4-type zinc finger protein [Xanthomonadaceae bacterium]|nr:TraR/DksA C4-type zinc finger protein [Xanthomonadaceae bacterium]